MSIETEIARLEDRIARIKAAQTYYDAHPDHLAALLASVNITPDLDADAADAAWEWLCRPIFRMQDKMPIEAHVCGRWEEFERLILAIQHGVFI